MLCAADSVVLLGWILRQWRLRANVCALARCVCCAPTFHSSRSHPSAERWNNPVRATTRKRGVMTFL